MHIMGVQAVLVVLVLFTSTVKSESGDASFWRNNVTLTCPEYGSWHGKDLTSAVDGTYYTFKYQGKASYYCEYSDPKDSSKIKYHFHVEGKVCENCFELDALMFGLALAADMVMTIFIMMVIYKYTEKKTSAAPTHSSRARGHSGGPAPPIPSPDYAPLNPHTRSQAVYSTVVNRTG
ncbi:T-cell surface glycoprotein CD3 epsilon chain-like [Parambassis ranga]|uniref:T-cell surface glycoprotein CD3 epsilon chain-like n=1 Tax=Parambassis ranga TaxID=210632 RepID=A0A6P7JE57_9TELE|nr:T-cell surface glycoprotein CD3 epsilon chain [Parambassis ranga]